MAMHIVVRRFRFKEVLELGPVQQAFVDTLDGEPGGIPSGLSYMPPGHYLFAGSVYDCTQSGIYRFFRSDQRKIHSRLVYDGSDILGAVSGFSWHSFHGVRDKDKYSNNELSTRGNCRVWSMKCGEHASLLKWFGNNKWNVDTRRVHVNAAGNDQWQFANGHIAAEMKIDGQWRHVDVNIGFYFTDLDGNHLSTQEAIDAGPEGRLMVELDRGHDRGDSLSDQLDSNLNHQVLHLSEEPGGMNSVFMINRLYHHVDYYS